MLEKQKIQRITTKAIFERNGTILFVKDTKGCWELPGGTIQFGETPEEALAREMTEELGIQGHVGRLVYSWSRVIEQPNAVYQFVGLVFVCSGDLSVITLSDEHTEYAWFAFNEIESLLPIGENHKASIRAFCAL